MPISQLSLIDSAENPYGAVLAFVAESQTHGRGQRANTWTSPKGSNFYGTFVIRTENMPFYAPLISSLAIAETLEEYMASDKYSFKENEGGFGIKWVNDVLYDNLKVAGSLL